jgi:cytochrome c peroxidase
MIDQFKSISKVFIGSPAYCSSTNWSQIKAEVEALLKEKNCGPLLVRLSWHAAGTYSKIDNTGGCGATMRFAPESLHGANAGLQIARDYLEVIHKKHPEVSYSDLWAFASNVAIEAMGGPKVSFRSGRKDINDPKKCTPDGRLPDATKKSNHIRDVFYRMGFNDQEITALIGAHTMGQCHSDRSGFVGPWTRDPYGFSNAYFVELLEQRWEIKPKSNPEQYQDVATKELMMLPADMEFLFDPEFRKWVEIYARDPDRFNADFAAAYQKLQECGVPTGQLSLFPVKY